MNFAKMNLCHSATESPHDRRRSLTSLAKSFAGVSVAIGKVGVIPFVWQKLRIAF